MKKSNLSPKKEFKWVLEFLRKVKITKLQLMYFGHMRRQDSLKKGTIFTRRNGRYSEKRRPNMRWTDAEEEPMTFSLQGC